MWLAPHVARRCTRCLPSYRERRRCPCSPCGGLSCVLRISSHYLDGIICGVVKLLPQVIEVSVPITLIFGARVGDDLTQEWVVVDLADHTQSLLGTPT